MKATRAYPRSMSSDIREIMNKVVEQEDVIHLEIGEPSFQTPQHIVEAGVLAARNGFTKYTANAGLLSLRKLIIEKLRTFNGIRTQPENITVTPGAVAALATSLAILVESGDEVLIPDPSWPNYEMQVSMAGGRPVRYPLHWERGFHPDVKEIEGLITPRTKVLMINSPSNPTGAVFPRTLLISLYELAGWHDLYLISDEVYEQIIFSDAHFSPGSIDTDGRVISLYSFSKGYAMTGWRVGYAVSPSHVAEVLTKVQEVYSSCVCTMAQKAAEAALTGPQDCVADMCATYQQRRDLALGVAASVGIRSSKPSGAFYMMLDISETGLPSKEFAYRLLADHSVAVAPGSAFGPNSNHLVRISLASSEQDLEEGLIRIGRFIEGLRGPRQAGSAR